MFDKDFKISGKHANYWKDLCELAGNVPDREQHSNFKIFNVRFIRVYKFIFYTNLYFTQIYILFFYILRLICF